VIQIMDRNDSLPGSTDVLNRIGSIGIAATWFLLLLIVQSLWSLDSVVAQDGTPIELRLVASFPRDEVVEGVYLQYPIASAVDGQYIYLLDFSASCLVKFDFDGDVVAVHEARGRGPGEFLFPVAMAINADNVFVLNADRRLQVFSKDLDYLDGFIVSRTSNEIVADGSSIFTGDNAHVVAVAEDGVTDGFPLHSYDLRGDLHHSFGSAFQLGEEIPQYDWHFLGLTRNGELVRLSRYYPRLQIYNRGGSLIRDVELSLATEYLEEIGLNLDGDFIREGINEGRIPLTNLFAGMAVSEDAVYALRFSTRRIVIDQYDFQGVHSTSYHYDLLGGISEDSSRAVVHDLKVTEDESGTLRFVVVFNSSADGIPQVGVFSTR